MTSVQIVLASSSPFRRELLMRLGIPFTTDNPSIDETPLPAEKPEETALRLSRSKALAVAERYPDGLIIGSDQVAFFGTHVFGKPGTHSKAKEQLRAMSGQTVNFFTGLCVLNSQQGKIHLHGEPTLVTFRSLTEVQIENYLIKEKPYNCAGSAKSEGLGIAIIEKIQGNDPNALIGLPLIALCKLLAMEGINII